MIFNEHKKETRNSAPSPEVITKATISIRLALKVMLSGEELAALIGQEIFDLAEAHYHSDNYQDETPAPEPEPRQRKRRSGITCSRLPAALINWCSTSSCPLLFSLPVALPGERYQPRRQRPESED